MSPSNINKPHILLFLRSIYNIISHTMNFNLTVDDKEIIEINNNKKLNVKFKVIGINEFKNEYIPKLNRICSMIKGKKI
jgi:hypothetical protein